jgi:hypothetical protein
MTERPHESEDLEDYEVLDTSDTLAGPPGDDPLDRGVATPAHWSAAMRSDVPADEQADESIEELLAEEEPDVYAEGYGEDDFADLDENEPEDDVRRAFGAVGPDLRAGRLVAGDDESAGDGEAIGFDAGVDSGGATAEEAAVHVLDDEGDSGAE